MVPLKKGPSDLVFRIWQSFIFWIHYSELGLFQCHLRCICYANNWTRQTRRWRMFRKRNKVLKPRQQNWFVIFSDIPKILEIHLHYHKGFILWFFLLSFLCTLILQAGDIVGAKARADESDGQKVALEDHVKTLKVWTVLFYYYRPHPKNGKATVFTGVCLSTPRGGVPQSQVLSQVSGPRSFPGGYPSPRWREYCSPRQGGTPVPDRTGLGNPTPPPPPDRTTDRVLATRRAVCILRSRRRTFLFYYGAVEYF